MTRPAMLTTHLLNFFPPSHLCLITSINLSWGVLPIDEPYPRPSSMNAFADITDETKAAAFAAYDAVWAALAALPKLARLRVSISALPLQLPSEGGEPWKGEYPPPPEGLKEAWLEPMERLREKNLAVFEVGMPDSFVSQFMGRWSESIKEYRELVATNGHRGKDGGYLLFATVDILIEGYCG